MRADVRVGLPDGIHARPASQIAELARKSSQAIVIGRPAGAWVKADSLLEILTLGIRAGEPIYFEVRGDDATTEASLLKELVNIVSGAQSH